MCPLKVCRKCNYPSSTTRALSQDSQYLDHRQELIPTNLITDKNSQSERMGKYHTNSQSHTDTLSVTHTHLDTHTQTCTHTHTHPTPPSPLHPPFPSLRPSVGLSISPSLP